MKPAHEKYIPFVPLKMARRAWPDRELCGPAGRQPGPH